MRHFTDDPARDPTWRPAHYEFDRLNSNIVSGGVGLLGSAVLDVVTLPARTLHLADVHLGDRVGRAVEHIRTLKGAVSLSGARLYLGHANKPDQHNKAWILGSPDASGLIDGIE